MKRPLLLLALCLVLLTACTSRTDQDMPGPSPTPSPGTVETAVSTPEPTPDPLRDVRADPILLPDPTPDPLTSLRAQVAEGDTLCGVLYLGYELDTLSPDFDNAQVAALYPWSAGCPYVDAGGDDLFLLIPVTESVAVTVQAVALTEDGTLEPTGEILYSGVGEVALLRCNVSDIMPNTLVTAVVPDLSLEFSPSISLKDGRVYAPGAVDLTVYPEGMEFEE